MRISLDGRILPEIIQRLTQDGYLVNVLPTTSLFHKYQNNKSRYAFTYHSEVMKTYLEIPYIPNQLNLYELSPYTFTSVFEPLDYENKYLEADEHQLYQSLWPRFVWKPNAIIYLYSDPKINPDLSKLHLKYEIAFDDHNCSIPIYKINSHEDIDTVYRNLREIFHKLSLIIA